MAGCAGGPQFETLSARVVTDTPQPLPADATLEVQLENTSTGDVLASSRVERLGDFPLPVTLQYAPEAIVADDLYRLDAQIRSGNRIVYLSPEALPVFGRHDSDARDIRVEPTGAAAFDGTDGGNTD